MDSIAIYKGLGYSTEHSLPDVPANNVLSYSDIPYPDIPPRLVTQKIPLAIPPGPNLPPIPGTPMTGLSNRSSANPSLRAEEGVLHPPLDLTLFDGDAGEEDEVHVRF